MAWSFDNNFEGLRLHWETTLETRGRSWPCQGRAYFKLRQPDDERPGRFETSCKDEEGKKDSNESNLHLRNRLHRHRLRDASRYSCASANVLQPPTPFPFPRQQSPKTDARPAYSNRTPTCQTTATNFATKTVFTSTTYHATTCFATTCIHWRPRTRDSTVLGFRHCSKRNWNVLRLLEQVQTCQDLHCETWGWEHDYPISYRLARYDDKLHIDLPGYFIR